MKSLFFDLVNYLGFLPIVFAIIYWKYLIYSTKIIMVGYIILKAFSVLANILGYFRINNLFVFSIMAILHCLYFCYFFIKISQNQLLSRLISVLYGLNFLFIVGVIFRTGFYQFNMTIFYGTNILSCIFLIYYLRINYTRNTEISKKHILFVLIYLFIITFSEIFTDFLSDRFYRYFGNKFLDIIWLYIKPFFNIMGITILCYALFLSKKIEIPKFDKIKDFND